METKATILIVDDEPSARATLQLLLEPEAYTLAFATNGAEAVALARQLTPDVILCDVMMPEMDGFEVCRRLRADPRLAEVPIVLVTALDSRISKLNGLEAGADDFITKPYDRVELRARVRTTVRLNRYRRGLIEHGWLDWVLNHSDDSFRFANARARLLLGLPEQAAAPLSGAFHDWASRQYQLVPAAAWEGWPTPSHITLRLPRLLVRPETPTAPAFWLQVTQLDLPEAAETGRVLRLRDVTSQMAAQRDQRSFHTALSHKLRTPLNDILDSLLLIAQDKQLPPATSALVALILGSANRLKGELSDIQQYLEISANTGPAGQFALAALPALVTAVSAEMGLTPVVAALPAEGGARYLPLAARAVETIFWELFENAKKFHPAHTPALAVTVTLPRPGYVCLQVRDDGVTLSPEQLAQAWNLYYQGEKLFTGEIPGTGLGLAVVAALVWNAGGDCRLFNRDDGPGVVVALTLPVASGPLS